MMDPSKNIGKMEQVGKEHKARRNYPLVWDKVADAETNRFYHPDYMSQQLKEQLKLKDLCPYVHNNKGESFFISPEMYEALLTKCRCGRPRTDIHLSKCLQKAVNPYLKRNVEQQHTESAKKLIAPTSNSSIGWLQDKPAYYRWEQSMKYISPVYSMPGPRIADAPYHTIFIG